MQISWGPVHFSLTKSGMNHLKLFLIGMTLALATGVQANAAEEDPSDRVRLFSDLKESLQGEARLTEKIFTDLIKAQSNLRKNSNSLKACQKRNQKCLVALTEVIKASAYGYDESSGQIDLTQNLLSEMQLTSEELATLDSSGVARLKALGRVLEDVSDAEMLRSEKCRSIHSSVIAAEACIEKYQIIPKDLRRVNIKTVLAKSDAIVRNAKAHLESLKIAKETYPQFYK